MCTIQTKDQGDLKVIFTAEKFITKVVNSSPRIHDSAKITSTSMLLAVKSHTKLKY